MTVLDTPRLGIHFKDIDKRYGATYALRRVSFNVAPGDCTALTGRNGSGKTTLLRIAAGLARPSSGTVNFATESSVPPVEKPRISFVAHATMLYDELTAEENLTLFASLQGIKHPSSVVARILNEASLSDRAGSLVRTFSRGMRQRLAIAKTLLQPPSVLLLDEPATGLDQEGISWLAKRLTRLRDSGCTILMSLHGESSILSLATRIIQLDAGSIVADSRNSSASRALSTLATD